MKFSPAIIALLLTSLLFTTSGTAQQVESEASDTTETADKAESEATKTTPPAHEKPQAATRFIPTEKIHADDAVSFPIDI